MQFNLEEAIRGWRKTLRQQPGLEPGYIEEIESHLRDRIDDYCEEGKTEEEAFRLAQAKSVDSAETLADDYFIARTNGRKTPPWKRKLSILYLMPNYLKIAARNFSRKSVYTGINLIGLVLGILGVALAVLYIQYETSFDQFHSKADQLYRVARMYRSQDYSVVSFDGYNSSTRETQLQQVNEIRNLPGVEDACHFFIFDNETFVETPDKKLAVDQILSTNTPASFFAMFDWQFLLGDTSAVVKSTNQAVLTRSAAEDLYGPDWASANLLSQLIIIEDTAYLLAGVIEDIPENSHYEFNILLHQPRIDYWSGRTYVEL
ncbi:MAG: ABC transporter permease, partial [Bacteroidota bacterium]